MFDGSGGFGEGVEEMWVGMYEVGYQVLLLAADSVCF